MRTGILTLLAAATVAVAAPTAASAATTITGGFSAGLANISSSTPGIAAGSTLTSAAGVVLGSSGDMSGIPLFSTFTASGVTATSGAAVSFSSVFGSYAGQVASVITGTNFLTIYTLGNFTPTGALSGFSAGAASVTYTFNQAGGAGADISGSFSFASPPSGIPEPATWGMMIVGAGMAGAAARRRRASTKVAVA